MSAFVRYVVILLCCSILVVDLSFSEITRTLKPPYLRNNFNPYYIPDTTSTTTAEAFIPEIIVNRNLRDEFNSVRQSDGFFPYLNNSYLPPSNQPPLMDIPETTLSTRPPISFDPIDTPTAYIPPTVAQNPNDVMSDFPPKATSNPDGYKYLPPTQQPPTVQQDPDLSDNFIPVISPPSQAYLPSQSKARELRDELIFRDPENVQSSQLQLDLNELRCLPNAGGYFRATLSVQSFVQNLPVVENDIQDLRCDLQVIRTRIVINIASVDFRRCGVENCGSQQLCLKIRFPQIQGLRTLADSVLTLQCRTQDRVVSKTHALRIGLNRENQARAAGTLANGGSQLPFRTQMGIYRLGNNGFTRNLEPGGVVLLGEELMLRAHVKFGDGWNFTRISDVSLQRLNPSGDILNSVVLVTSSGCVHPSMRSICPQPPTFEPPLGHRFGFRAVMFQGMRSGDEMIMSVKIVGCIDQSDCFVVKEISNSMIQTNLQSNVCPENTFKSAKERLLAPHAKRKFSYPVSLQASTFLSDAGSLSARRRLSNVSDVVSRKLSSTIGWKSQPIPTHDIIMQGKCLCGQYIRSRLKRSGIFNKKLGLQRLRSIIGTPAAHVVREVFPALNYIGEELERMHPKLYTSVTRQISRKAGGELSSAESASVLLSSVARDLFRNDITWGKVVSLFAITGGLAVDCVRQGHAEYLTQLVEGIAAVIEDELVAWINENGGWIGLTIHVRPESSAFSVSEWSAIFVGCFTGFVIIFYLLKFIGFQIVPKIFFK